MERSHIRAACLLNWSSFSFIFALPSPYSWTCSSYYDGWSQETRSNLHLFHFLQESQQVLLKILSMPSKIRILKFLQKKKIVKLKWDKKIWDFLLKYCLKLVGTPGTYIEEMMRAFVLLCKGNLKWDFFWPFLASPGLNITQKLLMTAPFEFICRRTLKRGKRNSPRFLSPNLSIHCLMPPNFTNIYHVGP